MKSIFKILNKYKCENETLSCVNMVIEMSVI